MMNKTLLLNLLAALGFNGLFAGGTYYTLMRNTTVRDGEIIRTAKAEIPLPVTTGTQSSNGFEPLTAGSNFTIFAKKPKTQPAMIVDSNSGNVFFPQGLIGGQFFDAQGDQIIDADGKWVGDPVGLKGDKGESCAMVDGTTKIKCGSSGPEIDLKGTTGTSCAMVNGTTKIKCGTDPEVDIKGPMGIADLEYVEQPMVIEVGSQSSSFFRNHASCPAGKQALSGGCGFLPPFSTDTNLSFQLASSTFQGNGWDCIYDVRHFASGTPSVDTWAGVVCGKFTIAQ